MPKRKRLHQLLMERLISVSERSHCLKLYITIHKDTTMFNHVLVPVDGSQTSLQATGAIAEIFKSAPNVKVTIVLAISPLKVEETDFDAEYVEKHNNAMLQRANGVLNTISGRFAEQGITHTAKVIQGDPVSAAIVNEASAGNYDLIAMGSHGLGMEKSDSHYLGSVTERVIRRTDLPVMVIPVHRIGKGRGD